VLPSAAASRAPLRRWNEEEDAKLTDAMKKHGKRLGRAVAALAVERIISVVNDGQLWILPMEQN
jgi:hypothetical protein